MNDPRSPYVPGAPVLGSPDEAEAWFYEALAQGNLQQMMAVWADDEEIACVLPGGPRAMGPAGVGAAFETVFANGPVSVQIEQVRRMDMNPSCAVHHVTANVRAPTPHGMQMVVVLATNVFVRTPMGWRVMVHHASVGMPPGAPRSEAAPPQAMLH